MERDVMCVVEMQDTHTHARVSLVDVFLEDTRFLSSGLFCNNYRKLTFSAVCLKLPPLMILNHI